MRKRITQELLGGDGTLISFMVASTHGFDTVEQIRLTFRHQYLSIDCLQEKKRKGGEFIGNQITILTLALTQFVIALRERTFRVTCSLTQPSQPQRREYP